MSSSYVKLGDRSLDQWKVTELKEELKRRKLATKGLKEELVKRLDEAVRSEMENSTEDVESDENDANQSEPPFEQAKTDADVSGGAKDFMDVGISMDEKADAKPEHEVDDRRSLFEGKVEVSLEQGTKTAELEGGHDAEVAPVETTVVINETVEVVTVVSVEQVDNDGPNEDGDSIAVTNNDGLPLPQEDAKLELSDASQLPMINESSTPVTLSVGPNLEDDGTQDEASLSTVQMETDDPKYLQPDSNVQPLKYQVSEVEPDLGFQVTSDSVCTESVSIIEKNELKVDVITDNVQLDLDLKHEMEQPLASSVLPDGGESHPLGVEESLNNTNIKEPLDQTDIDETNNGEPLNKTNIGEPLDGKNDEPLEKKDFEEQLEKKDVEEPLDGKNDEPLEKKDFEEPLEKKDVEEPLDEKNDEEPLDKKDFEEPLDKKNDEGPLDKKDVEEPLDKKNDEGPLDKKVFEEPLDKKDFEEPLDRKDFEEPLDKKDVEGSLVEKVSVETTGGSNAEMADIDREDLVPEKLNLDRSSGDDSMEEDIVESKPMEYKMDSSKIDDNVGKYGRPTLKEEDHVDVVGHDKSVETKPTTAENEIGSASASLKRKFHDIPDKAAVVNNDPVKKVRRWNAEGLKDSEPQSGTRVVSTMPKDLSIPTFKPLSGKTPAVNEEAPKERIVPPSSKPHTNSLRIDRFLRPFTLKQVQELLGRTGNVTGFWMDHIKTHCYVSYSSIEEAVETRNAVYNLQWPSNGGRLLVAEFVDPQEVKSRVTAPPPPSPATPSTSVPQNNAPPQPSPRPQIPRHHLPPPPPPPPLANPPPPPDRMHRETLPREHPIPSRERLNLPPPPPLPEKAEPPIVTLDDLFRKTKSTPRIYYLPLSDEQVAAKTTAQGKNAVNRQAKI